MRKRNHTVTIRMNNEEYNLLQNKVKESGRTQQEVVIKAIADLKIASTEEVEELKRLNQMFADILSQLRGATTNINQIARKLHTDGEVPNDSTLYFLNKNILKYRKESEKICLKALELGFSSIMYDCSTDSYEDNVRKVKEMADIAHSYGATIEGELGHVGDNPDSAEGSAHINPADFYTDPRMAKDFVDKTGVDALAIAVGTAHGAYKLPPKLDFERINTIAHTVDVPLVLHGGSGLTDNDFKRAIQEGISKINIFTDINVAAVEAEFRKFESMNKGIIDLIPAAVEAVKQETMKKMILFSSNGKGVLDQPSQDELVKAVVQGVLKEIVGK